MPAVNKMVHRPFEQTLVQSFEVKTTDSIERVVAAFGTTVAGRRRRL